MLFKALLPGLISPFQHFQYNPIGQWTKLGNNRPLGQCNGLYIGDTVLVQAVIRLKFHSVKVSYKNVELYVVEADECVPNEPFIVARRVKLIEQLYIESTTEQLALQELQERYHVV